MVKIKKLDIGKASVISIGIGLLTLGYSQVQEGNLEIGLLMVGLGLGCIVIGIALQEEESPK